VLGLGQKVGIFTGRNTTPALAAFSEQFAAT